MDLKKLFATDDFAENEGVWVELAEGMRFKIARAGNRANQDLVQRLMRQKQAALRVRKLAADIMEDITYQAMSQTILLDWENVQDGEEDLPYSHENAYAMLKKYKDFREFVSTQSMNQELFRQESEEAAQKN